VLAVALTLTVTGLKGGVGKSTLALNLGSCLHRAGHRTLLVDSDSQATLRTWAAKGAEQGYDGPPVVGLDGRTLRRDLEHLARDFDVAVIDSPPRLGTEARASMLVADLVLLPVVPGAADVWALKETLTVLDDARGLRPELPAAIVLNRADRTSLAQLTREAVSGLNIAVLESTLGARVAFGEATLAGQGVIDYAPTSPAAEEVQALTREILRAIGGTNGQKGNRNGNGKKIGTR
jgi:chromosome partitioning protein